MARADARQLLADAAWLRRLARTLAGGADGDDLAQEVWLAALRNPPDGDRPARPWLASVLRNTVRMRARANRRRRQRELTVAGEPVAAAPSPTELLERAEAQRDLADLLVRLDEPFRRTVLLHYEQGMSAAQIARADGIPEGTVRWRLKEGLDRLRTGLDQRHGGQRRRWAIAFAGLPLPAAAPASGTGAADTLIRGAIMANRTRRAAVVALLLLGAGGGAAWWWTRDRGEPADGERGPGASADRPAALPAGGGGPDQQAPGAEIPAGRRALAIADAAASSGIMEGRVLNWSTGEPVDAVEVVIGADEGTHTLATDADGRFRFVAPRPGSYRLAVLSKPGFLPYAPELDDTRVAWTARPGTRVTGLIIYLSPAIDYHGKVVSASGAPVAGASVKLLEAARSEQALEGLPDRFTTDARGEFTFHAPDYAVLEASARGHGTGRAVLDGAAQASHKLTIRLPAAGSPLPGRLTIAGRVVDSSGRPLEGAAVLAIPAEGHGPGGVTAGTDVRIAAAATTEEDGRFLLRGIDPGRYQVRASQPGHGDAATEVDGGDRDVKLQLPDAGRIAGRVVDSAVAPVPAFSVIVRRGDAGLQAPVVATASVVDAEGRFTIDDLAAGGYKVVATALGRAPAREVAVQVSAGKTAEVELRVPAGGVVFGTVVSRASGKPLQYARVSVEGTPVDNASVTPAFASVVTDAAGAFELDGLAPGLRSITIGAYNHDARIVSGLEVVDGGRIGPLRIELTEAGDKPPGVEIVGIGCKLMPSTDALVVQEVIPGGGAAEAGITAGDGIVAIDGLPVTTLGFEDSLQRIRGIEGTQVRLLIRRGTQTLDIPVTRRKIRA